MAEISVKDTITNLLVDKLGYHADEITPEASLVEDLGADSLEAVEIIMEVESAYNIGIPDEDAEGIKTVGQLVAYVEGKITA